jgi:predicted alpha/beta-fold hydrolase
MHYNAPLWLPGGNLQTIWPALYSRRYRGAKPRYTRQRWASPDGDFVDVDWMVPDANVHGALNERTANTLLVLFHGLEGSSGSHYAEAFAEFAQANGLAYAVPHFRGCSGEINAAPRAYHSGDHEEIDWVLQRFHREWVSSDTVNRKIIVVGVSLGGNALLRWAEEQGGAAAQVVHAVASICAPLDLAASGKAIGTGFNKWVYTRMFLRTMKPRALKKWDQHPGLFDKETLQRARDLYEFDNVFTAPLHGFKDTDDYWARCSSKSRLSDIQIPALVVNALNDPFVPAYSLPKPSEVGSHVTLWQPKHGGHVGFAQGPFPGHVHAIPEVTGRWLLKT